MFGRGCQEQEGMKQGVWCLCPGVTVLGGKVRATMCVGVHTSCSSLALAPGETVISHLPLLPQVARHQRTSPGICSVVTKTLDPERRKDLDLKIAVPIKSER